MSNKSLAVIILAAGKGTRMKSARPKVMHALAGLPMINWLLKTTEQLSPAETVVVVGPDMPDLEAAVKPHKTVVQKTRNGTGGALKVGLAALEGFKGDILVLLGDAPLVRLETLQGLIAAKQEDRKAGLSVLGMEMPDPTGYGRLITNRDGTLAKIVEEKDASDREKKVTLVNSGVFCVDGNRTRHWIERVNNHNAQGEYYITDLPAIAADEGAPTKISIASNPEELRGCNSRADLAALETMVQNQLRVQALENGVTMTDPASVYLHHDSNIAPDVTIEPQVFFGPGVTIDSGAYIKAFTHIEGAHIKSGASIGPYARIRPGTKIDEGARIGNFVEIKKSHIGARSKIGHLSYVGDCDMGDDVNFSAGAITVNYDGFEKHKTIIGKGVMIGSNVNLVAPVEIDDGAFVAAGSTITENVPAGALSIARDAASIREGWATEYRKRKAALVKKIARKKKSS